MTRLPLSWLLPAVALLLASGSSADQDRKPPEAAWQPMFDGQTLKGWRPTPFTGQGPVRVKDGTIVLGAGSMTGVTWTNPFPKSNYEIRFEAARVEGSDFFASITFPVKDAYCSWINGGWGGKVVGLSSLDGNDASENDTSATRDFEKGRWYHFWLAVTDDRIRAWIDEELVIDVQIKNREISLRPGEIELSKPLGIASYATTASLRKLEYRPLPPPSGEAKQNHAR
jgi:hypothetical protein